MSEAKRKVLLIRCADNLCALPLNGVIETMRALPREPIHHAPEFVLGMSLIRGEFVPVVDLSALLTGSRERVVGRYVSLVSGALHVALAVGEVLGVRELATEHYSELPELLSGRDSPYIVALARLDSHLLRVLSDARVWSEAVGDLAATQGTRADA